MQLTTLQSANARLSESKPRQKPQAHHQASQLCLTSKRKKKKTFKGRRHRPGGGSKELSIREGFVNTGEQVMVFNCIQWTAGNK